MMTWEVAGWHGGAALYHLEGCEKCDEYVAHVVEANSLNHINVSARDIEQALKVAWPDIIRDIEWDTLAGPHEDCENLQDEVDDLHHQLSDANKALNHEQDRAAYYKSELKKYQKPQSDTKDVMMSQPKAAPAPPVASSSQMMLDSPIKENPNERTILGTVTTL